MASIFILFPRDNSEYVPTALQHFAWAIERFEAMAERNRLAAAARRVLRAIHYRLEKALNALATFPTPLLGAAVDKSDFATAESTGSLEIRSLNRHKTTSVSTTTAESPSMTSNTGSSVSASTRGTSILTTPGESGDVVGGPTPTGTFTTVNSSNPIDPGLTGGDDNDDDSSNNNNNNAVMTGKNDWSLPDDFDWSSIQPVYAMADVAYNDLMRFSYGDNNTASSMPNWAGGTPLLNDDVRPHNGTTTDGAVGGDLQGWLFGGDFGNDSVWSLLNQYPPPL